MIRSFWRRIFQDSSYKYTIYSSIKSDDWDFHDQRIHFIWIHWLLNIMAYKSTHQDSDPHSVMELRVGHGSALLPVKISV